MSNRLESLNSKPSGLSPSSSGSSPAAPTPPKKFKPKVVNRKSKEEREVPVEVKHEERKSTRGSTRGRGRGGRNNYAGTHVVSSGPLSSGSVSMGDSNGTKLGLTADRTFNSVSPTPEFLQNLKLKEKPLKKETTASIAHEDESDDDATKINMTQEYRFADEETVLFPVRPERELEEVRGDTPEVVTSRTQSPEVKSDPDQKVVVPTEVDQFEREEQDKMITDHEDLVRYITGKFENTTVDDITNGVITPETATSDKYLVFQLPNKLPTYTLDSSVKQEPGVEEGSGLKGQIGHINIHQSGKITINLGNDNNLLVSKGNATSFLQEVVVLERSGKDDEDIEMMDEEGRQVKGSFLRLGEVEEKMIGVPMI